MPNSTQSHSETFAEGLERLRALQDAEPQRSDCPATVPVRDLRTAPSVFQPRTFEEDTEDGAHVAALVHALRAKPEDRRWLDPLLVLPVGQAFYVVDGHHRLAAYGATDVTAPVPVDVFPGTLEEAVKEAIHRNAKDRLSMSHSDKLEAAWRMVGLGPDVYSKSEIAEATGSSERTVANMRRTLRELQERGHYEPHLSWAVALRALNGEDRVEFDDAARAALARDYAQRLRKTFGPKLTKQADTLATALELFSKKLPRKLVEEWADLAVEVAESWNQETAF